MLMMARRSVTVRGSGQLTREISKSTVLPAGPRMRLTTSDSGMSVVDAPSIARIKSSDLRPARCAGVSSMGDMTVSFFSRNVMMTPTPP